MTHRKIQTIEKKQVNHFGGGRLQKTRGRKMKDSQAMLLKTNGSKMSEIGLFAMLMKINGLK
jgi:hypothetical protein